MLKFAPCIEMMFREIDFYDRFAAAKAVGVDAVDFWNWSNKDIAKIKALCKEHDIKIASMCVDTAVPEVSEVFNKKRLLYRDGVDAFEAATKESIAVAKELGVPSLIITVGQERNDTTRYDQHTSIVLHLKRVAPLLEAAGIVMIIEPLNVLCNHMGYFLPSSYEAFGIAEEVGSPNVKILYDIYHQQITEGNLIPTIRKNIDLIGHFHVADVPGRNQPGTGEINYKNVFAEIKALGYDKYVGLEYSPTIDTTETVKAVLALCE